MTSLRFLAAWLVIPVLGAGAAFHPSLRRDGVFARGAAALGLGTVFLTLSGLILSLVGVAWTLPRLAALPLAASATLGTVWSRRAAVARTEERPCRLIASVSGVVIGVTLLLLGWTLVTAGATSLDYLLFWGSKAARFAESRAVNADLLRWKYFAYAVPDYPPSVPIVQAWGALAAGKMPWRFVPLTSLLWLAATVPLVRTLLARRIGGDGAASVTAFWTAAFAASLAFSVSGGNAEAPLLFFETGAVAALIVERDGTESRFLPGLLLTGAVLTKVEGSAAFVALVAGTFVRDALEKRPRLLSRTAALAAAPIAAVGAWFVFQRREGLAVGFQSHGPFFGIRFDYLSTILGTEIRQLEAGTYWLAWLVPLVLILAVRPPLRPLLPAAALIVGILGFLVFDYMHDANDPTVRIGWTAPRVSQPALSACILAAGLASLGGERRRSLSGEGPPRS